MSALSRKQFLGVLLRGAAGAVALAGIAACGDDGDDGGMPDGGSPDDGGGGSACEAADPTVEIATNHAHGAHSLVVPRADVEAGLEVTYPVMGAAVHTHMITVTAADMVTLQGGGTIMVTSTEAETHTHVVTVSCA